MSIVVIMEDDDVIRGLLARLVESRGYEVQAFEDAQPALDAVDFCAVDLIVTDLRMPLPGDKAVAQIRERGIETPVLFLTGELLSETREASMMALGKCRVMPKPFRIKELLGTIDEMLL